MPFEILAWTLIAAIYIAAFGVLRLEKHWHRTAEVFFSVATLLAVGRLVLWVWNNPDGLRGGIALVVATSAIVAAIWFVQKVEADIPKPESSSEAVEAEPLKFVYRSFLDGPANQPLSDEMADESFSFLPSMGSVGMSPTRCLIRLVYDRDTRAPAISIYIPPDGFAVEIFAAFLEHYAEIRDRMADQARQQNIAFDHVSQKIRLDNEVPLSEDFGRRIIAAARKHGGWVEFEGSVAGYPQG